MVRAGLLQPALHVRVEARAIADHDRGDDRRRPRAPSADGIVDRAPRKRAHGRNRLAPRRAARRHLDEGAALHRADERRAAARERALVVGHAGIEVARRTAKLHRKTNTSSGAPRVDLVRGERAGDGDDDAAVRQKKGSYPFFDVEAQRDARLGRRRVRPQDPLDDRERLIVFGETTAFARGLGALVARERLERRAQRRTPGALPGDVREQRAAEEEGRDDRAGQRARPRRTPRVQSRRRRRDKKKDGRDARDVVDETAAGDVGQAFDGAFGFVVRGVELIEQFLHEGAVADVNF